MDDVSRILTMLAATRPSVSWADLAEGDRHATFEAHVPAESGDDFWIYTVNGHTVDGDCIVVRAKLPIQAETVAQEGLQASCAAAKTYDAGTGLHATVEMRPAHEVMQ